MALLSDLVEASDASVARACHDAGALLAAERGLELRAQRLDWRAEGFGKVLAFELAETWGERVDAEPSRFSELIREHGRLRPQVQPRGLPACAQKAHGRTA